MTEVEKIMEPICCTLPAPPMTRLSEYYKAAVGGFKFCFVKGTQLIPT